MKITIEVDTVKDEPKEIEGVLTGIAKLFSFTVTFKPMPASLRPLEDLRPLEELFCFVEGIARARAEAVMLKARKIFGIQTIRDLSFITNKELFVSLDIGFQIYAVMEIKICDMYTVYAVRRAICQYYINMYFEKYRRVGQDG